MAQITNAQLFGLYEQLEQRMQGLDQRMQKLEQHQELTDKTLSAVNTRLDSIDRGIRLARNVLIALGAIIGPAITAIIVMLIERLF